MQNILWHKSQASGRVVIRTWAWMHSTVYIQEHQWEVPSGVPRGSWSWPTPDPEACVCPVLSRRGCLSMFSLPPRAPAGLGPYSPAPWPHSSLSLLSYLRRVELDGDRSSTKLEISPGAGGQDSAPRQISQNQLLCFTHVKCSAFQGASSLSFPCSPSLL